MDDLKKKDIEHKNILKEVKDYIHWTSKTMTEAEYWKSKYYGDFNK